MQVSYRAVHDTAHWKPLSGGISMAKVRVCPDPTGILLLQQPAMDPMPRVIEYINSLSIPLVFEGFPALPRATTLSRVTSRGPLSFQRNVLQSDYQV